MKQRLTHARTVAGLLMLAGCMAAVASIGALAATSTVAADEVVIAHAAPLSPPGDYKVGREFAAVVDLWAKTTNTAGGVVGQKVKVVRYDEKGKPELAASVVTRAIRQNRAVLVLGGWNSSVCISSAEVAHRYKVPYMSTGCWTDDLTAKNYPEIFRIGPYNSLTALGFAPFIKAKRWSKVAILAENTDLGKGLANAIKRTTKGATFNVTEYQYDATDLAPQLARIVASKPDALIVIAGYTPAQFLAITQARELGYTGPIVTGWDYPNTPAYWDATQEKGVGVIYPSFTASKYKTTRAGERFKSLYRKARSKDPTLYEYLIWDSLETWKWAATKAGSTKPSDVVPWMAKANLLGTLGRITFSRKRGTVHFNQWEGQRVYFKQLTAVNQRDENAKVIYVAGR
jgi:branched-chain amino acid transport system substrate-binding protein